MNGLSQVVGPAVVAAPSGAVASLMLTLVSAVLFTIGWRLAAGGRFPAHCRVQTVAACLNAVVVLAWMIRSFVLNVAPEIPARLDQTSYAVATVHAAVGAVGLVLGGFVVLRANKLVPRALAFTAYKPFMRGSYTLYMLGTLTGVILYVVAYVG